MPGTMVFTANQTMAFFEDADQMALPHDTRLQLANEGINLVVDLAGFDKDAISQIASNLKKPGDCIPNPDPNADPGLMNS